MNFAICVAPAACVVRVAVTSSAVFALRVAVAARIVSTASFADGFIPRLAARTAGIVLRTLWYGVVFSVALAPARNPSLKQNSHTSGQQELPTSENASLTAISSGVGFSTQVVLQAPTVTRGGKHEPGTKV